MEDIKAYPTQETQAEKSSAMIRRLEDLGDSIIDLSLGFFAKSLPHRASNAVHHTDVPFLKFPCEHRQHLSASFQGTFQFFEDAI